MGRIRYVLYQITKVVPKKYKKPFYSVSAVLGLIAFFETMLYLSKSNYLYDVKNAIMYLYYIIIADVRFIMIILALGLLSVRKKYYQYLKNCLTLAYVIILILAILPYFGMGGLYGK